MTRWLIILLSAFVALSAGPRDAPAATVTVNGPAMVGPGATITATVAGGPGNPGDWLGVYAVGAPANTANPPSWKWLSTDDARGTIPPTGVTAGTVHLLVPSLAGKYEVRFLLNNGYTVSATSAPITVGGVAQATKDITWEAGHDLASIPFGWFPQGATIRSINCNVETPVGAAAVFQLVKAPSGTPLAKGQLISFACDANLSGTANQDLLPPGTTVAVNPGDRIGLFTASTAWAAGHGMGLVTVGYSIP